MTLKQFILALPEEGWYLENGRYLRRSDTCDCPIQHLFGRKDTETWGKIVNKGYLTSPVVGRIIAAADDLFPDMPTVARIRRALLKQCGLSHDPQ